MPTSNPNTHSGSLYCCFPSPIPASRARLRSPRYPPTSKGRPRGLPSIFFSPDAESRGKRNNDDVTPESDCRDALIVLCRIARLVSGPATWARTGGDVRRLERLGSTVETCRRFGRLQSSLSTPPCDPGEEQPGRKQRRRKLCAATATRPPVAAQPLGVVHVLVASQAPCKQSGALRVWCCQTPSSIAICPALCAICRCPKSVREVTLATKPPGSW